MPGWQAGKNEKNMAQGIRFYETGAPEVMRWEEIAVGDPGAGEVLIRHLAVGLNYADTYFRSGLYPVPSPNGMGVEGAGIVKAVGEGVSHVAPVTLSLTQVVHLAHTAQSE